MYTNMLHKIFLYDVSNATSDVIALDLPMRGCIRLTELPWAKASDGNAIEADGEPNDADTALSMQSRLGFGSSQYGFPHGCNFENIVNSIRQIETCTRTRYTRYFLTMCPTHFVDNAAFD